MMTIAKWICVLWEALTKPKAIGRWFCPVLFFSCAWSNWPVMAAETRTPDAADGHHRLVICLPAGVDSMDPTNHRSRITQIVLKHLFDSLTTRNSTNDVIPQLAQSWRLIDSTQWQFKLRRGVRFHNGLELTAADVKFTLDRVIVEGALDGYTSPRRGLFKPISRVDVDDEYTLRIFTRYPWPNLPLMLSLQEIVPAAYMQALGTNGFEALPVGTGPFTFVRHVPGKEIVLERFDSYYGGSPQRPPVQVAPVKQLVFKVVPSHLDQIAMLKSGGCDIITHVPADTVPILKMSPDIRVLQAPATRSYFAEINCTRSPMDDRRIRRALNYAVDIDALVTHKLKGYGKTLPTVLLPNAFGYHPQLRPYSFNRRAARQLLETAAYPEDRRVVIFSHPDNLIFAQSIAMFLTQVGLQSRIKVSSSVRPQTTGTDAPWDLFVGSWGNSTLDPVGILEPKFESKGYGNFSKFSSPAIDTLMIRARTTMDNHAREALYHQIQELVFSEAPMVFGYAPDEFYAVAARVKGFHPPSTGMIELHDVNVDKER
jgi:peptide/nickel transport system substrate-binding protein